MGFILRRWAFQVAKRFSTVSSKTSIEKTIEITGRTFDFDDMTNVTRKILSYIGRNLHLLPSHPLCHLQNRIKDHFYRRYVNARGNPLFSVYDRLSPIVTTEQNFDSLLISKDHMSRSKSDNYYINGQNLLRAHTTAHQAELIKMGLNNFLVIGDVYRRDAIDSSHFPVFHQVDGVRLFTKQDIFRNEKNVTNIELFENRSRTKDHQETHSDIIVKVLKEDLQGTLEALAVQVFGKDVRLQWVEAHFPFTHPSWELEVEFDNKWMEMLGCGIITQDILNKCGANDKVGWAFGLGLERWAMKLYQIPDIRIFWLEDERFYSQFNFDGFNSPVTFKPFSFHPPCYCDISFWLPKDELFSSEDFYDIIRSFSSDLIEEVKLIDEFTHPKTKLTSHCYRITYRSWERALRQGEVNALQEDLGRIAAENLGVTLRVLPKSL